MADESSSRTETVRVEISDQLPDGEPVMPLERDGELIWVFRPGHISPEAVDAINGYLRHIIRDGLWEQEWDGGPCAPPPPPQPGD